MVQKLNHVLGLFLGALHLFLYSQEYSDEYGHLLEILVHHLHDLEDP